MLAILRDVSCGAYSVLEQEYLKRVERPHGLPVGDRQRRDGDGPRVVFRDVDYPMWSTVVELDGRLGHEAARDRWRDLDRDLAATVSGSLTLRVGWQQVLEACRLADQVSRVLRARGWSGPSRACGPTCSVSDPEGLPASGAGDSSASKPGSGPARTQPPIRPEAPRAAC